MFPGDVCTHMRIRDTDKRTDLYEQLVDHTPSGTKSGALDDAAEYYLRMTGGNMVNASDGRVRELMDKAVEQGSVTPEEIAECLDTPQLPVQYSHSYSIGAE